MLTAAVSWPPPWDPAADSSPAGGGAPAPAQPVRSYPPTGWPTKDQLDYTQKLFAVVIIGLALPWLAKTLVTNPGRVMAGAAHQHVKPR